MTPQPRFRHDHVGFTTLRRIKASAIMKTSVRGVAAALGLVTVGWPLAWAPGWAYPVAGAGAVAVLAGAFAAWRRGPALAVAAAVAACAFSRAGTFVLAAEGLFILCYLLAADAPAGLSRGAGPGARPGSWLRHQVPGVLAGLVASGAVVAALAVHQASSAWLTAAGLAAVAAAYLVALPSKQASSQVPRQASSQASSQVPGRVPGQVPGRDSDVDVQ